MQYRRAMTRTELISLLRAAPVSRAYESLRRVLELRP